MPDPDDNATAPERSVAEVLESISDAFFALDRQWRFTYLNSAAERMLHRTRAELLGRNIWSEFPDAVHSRFYTEYHRTMDAGLPSQFEEYYPAPLDAWYEVRAYPTPAGLAVYFQNSTERRRDREQIRETADRLSLAMDTSGLGDYIWDVPSDRVHLSSQAAAHFGVPADIPITREQMLTMVDPQDYALAQERVAVALEHRGDYRIEYRVHRPDGTTVWVATRGRGIYDDSGKMIRLLGVMQDITDRHKTEDSLRAEIQINESLRSIGLSVASKLGLQELLQAITDAGTRIVRAQFGAFFYNTVSPAGESYVLYTISGVPREKFSQFPMPRNTAVFAPTFDGTGTIRINDVTKDPRYGHSAPYHGMPPGHLPVRSYLAVSVKARTGEVIGGLFFGHEQAGVFTDHDARIIEGVAAQAAVALDNARLYDAERRARADAEAANREKDQLLESERAARAEAEHASRTKDEFLATVSHELRTPLNAMLGWSQLLSANTSDPNTLREGLEVIRRNARVQAQLIEDLLDMSRIISGKLRLDVQRVDLSDVIDAAIESVRHSAEAKAVRLVKVIDPAAGAVRGDPNRLQQVVWNLLSNAIKFTPKEGRVQISLQRVNSHVDLAVSDTGIGIPPDFLPHVFERFRQADASTTRKHGGLGLGLSIVKSLVELHGGTVHALSAGLSHGTTFTVTLPITPITPQATAQPPDPISANAIAPNLKGLKILLVDDDPDARALLRRLLSDRGAEVETASSALEAIDAFTRRPPDLLVSDIGMPHHDGYELIRRIRALPAPHGPEVPAIALTAFARSEDRTRAMLAGYQMHLPKPIEAPELLAAIAALAWRV